MPHRRQATDEERERAGRIAEETRARREVAESEPRSGVRGRVDTDESQQSGCS